MAVRTSGIRLSPSRKRRQPAAAPPAAPPTTRPTVPPIGPTTQGLIDLFREDPPTDPEGLAFYRQALLRARALDFGIYQAR